MSEDTAYVTRARRRPLDPKGPLTLVQFLAHKETTQPPRPPREKAKVPKRLVS